VLAQIMVEQLLLVEDTLLSHSLKIALRRELKAA
jgi:hypothetical protein